MNHAERNALIATGGLAVGAVGAFLPWARIGGRNRSGFNTADTFISLANGALPDQIAWVGRWWYLPALLAFVAWITTFVGGHITLRVLGVVVVTVATLMWWLFVWAGENYKLLNMQFVGPTVATVGLIVLGTACARRRHSVVRPPESTGQTS